MGIHEKYQLSKIINARGTYTPLGVSRSTPAITAAVSEALSDYYRIDELQAVASKKIAAFTGSEAGVVTHCTAASISMAIAGIMTGTAETAIAGLPEVHGLKHIVIIPKVHVVNYGHSILQAIRLTGARPLVVGAADHCSMADLEKALTNPNVACLLLVSSRLVADTKLNLREAIVLAKKHQVPSILDAAAQDFRISALAALESDLILHSAQKYLRAPTAGIVHGKKAYVAAVLANEKGIGRAMKATKEVIVGVLAAIEARQQLDLPEWQQEQGQKVADFVTKVGDIPGLQATAVKDPTGLPFSRVCITVDNTQATITTAELAQRLKTGNPQIWVLHTEQENKPLFFELVGLDTADITTILEKLTLYMNA
ncbi:aminotransferase class V-fold PLP-dependent enzyme [Spongiimicrobium salis]|uniref:aminotransferase class V-fold PLP-dependent enzyme n=1 Tax=Spongiimicrobium salis TaxID=1667022 RepID=UPI00374D0075